MAEATFVPYNDETHRTDFYEINHEYLTGLDNELSTRYGINLNPAGTVKEYLDTVFQKFTEINPPEGIIYILELDGEMTGMGVLRKLDEGVGEIKRMYIRPKYQGYGFGKELYRLLENKAREFGFSMLRLDTAVFAEAAVHIYRKVGFMDVGEYSGGEWDDRTDNDDFAIYMEKKLTINR